MRVRSGAIAGIGSPPVECSNTGLKMRNKKCKSIIHPCNGIRSYSPASHLNRLDDNEDVDRSFFSPVKWRRASFPDTALKIEIRSSGGALSPLIIVNYISTFEIREIHCILDIHSGSSAQS